MNISSSLCRVVLCLAFTPLAFTRVNGATYTFNGLSAGNVAGQDGWVANFGDSSDVIQAGTGFNTSNVMANPVTAGPTGVHRMSRTNDANFSFGSLVGATGLTLSFDTQVYNNASDALDFINFGVADTADAHGSPALAFLQQNGGIPQVAFGSTAQSGTFNLPATTTNDWIRLSLVMDFTANSGQGTGVLTYQDLTIGGPVMTITSGLNLGNPTPNEAFWTTMWSRSDNGPGAALSHVVQDNLTVTPTFAAVPEMNGAWIAGGCALLLIGHWVRRARCSQA